mgnify:CR=1 FL=1|tara:strand:- start:475 stop:801 length:327 start_codon:yes stop_codon:yes gene_type:complete
MISSITSLLDHIERPQLAQGDPLHQFESELPHFPSWVEEKRIDSHLRELMRAEPRTAVVDAAVLLEEHLKHLLEVSTVRVEGFIESSTRHRTPKPCPGHIVWAWLTLL